MPRFSARKKNKDHMTLLHSMDSFQTRVAALRSEFGIESGGNTKPGQQARWVETIGSRVEEYVHALNQLVPTLPANFLRHVQWYVEEGIVSAPLNNFDITPEGNPARTLVPHIYTKLTQQEQEDLFADFKRMGTHLLSFGTVKNIKKMLWSEDVYKQRDIGNQDELREYEVTVSEYVGSKLKAKKIYEDKRMLNEQREKRFGKM